MTDEQKPQSNKHSNNFVHPFASAFKQRNQITKEEPKENPKPDNSENPQSKPTPIVNNQKDEWKEYLNKIVFKIAQYKEGNRLNVEVLKYSDEEI
jgi:hypothetical protein